MIAYLLTNNSGATVYLHVYATQPSVRDVPHYKTPGVWHGATALVDVPAEVPILPGYVVALSAEPWEYQPCGPQAQMVRTA